MLLPHNSAPRLPLPPGFVLPDPAPAAPGTKPDTDEADVPTGFIPRCARIGQSLVRPQIPRMSRTAHETSPTIDNNGKATGPDRPCQSPTSAVERKPATDVDNPLPASLPDDLDAVPGADKKEVPAGLDFSVDLPLEELETLRPGWGPRKIEQFVGWYLHLLAMGDVPGETVISELIGRLRKALRANGYNPLPQARYMQLFRLELEGIADRSRRKKLATTLGVPDTQLSPKSPFSACTPCEVDDMPLESGGCFHHVPGKGCEQLSNFVVHLDRDVRVDDDLEPHRRFEGRIWLAGRESPFALSARDFANNDKLRSAIFESAGPTAQLLCNPELLRTAISALSRPTSTHVTTNFGWTADNDFLTPSTRISARGFQATTEEDALRVDLSIEERARHLDLHPLQKEELQRVKKHIVEDLLALHDRRVTYSLLATAALSILYRFATSGGRYALWLTGLTGSGKSFLSKLFMNFFGDFPLTSGRFVTWSATPNYIQRQGYFFRDALYLVDDYKTEVIRQEQVVRILQTYADGTSRGRLKADATTNLSREIRGMLVATGEDVPEHTASALARSIVIEVPQRQKDLERGERCARECKYYSGVMADFVRHLIVNKRIEGFADRVAAMQQIFYAGIAGQQNDARIASNFALLAVAFEEMAAYLADVWPTAKEEALNFVEEDLVAVRDEMLKQVREQQASEIFLSTLATLIEQKQVKVLGYAGHDDKDAVVGRYASVRGIRCFELSTQMCLEAVNQTLQKQCRPPLKVTIKALLNQLAQEGILLDKLVQPVDLEEAESLTHQAWINGKNMRVFRITELALFSAGADRGSSVERL